MSVTFEERMSRLEAAVLGDSDAQPNPLTAIAHDAQIAPGNYIVTKLTVAALTLLAPIAGADDGKTLHVISATAAAHQITAPANSINGAFSTALFGGAVGDCLNLIAYNGTWLVLPSTHITLS